MKNVYQVLREKELELARVRNEVAALHTIIPLLTDAGDWNEQGVFPAPSSPNENEREKNVLQKPA